MKIISTILLFTFTALLNAQENKWKGYYSYNNINKITESKNQIITATENSVFSFNINKPNETKVYNTINNLKINSITCVSYNNKNKTIIVANSKGSIALINEINNDIVYLKDIANKTSLTDKEKEINQIIIKGNDAYVATGYGISKIIVDQYAFGDTYYIGENASKTNVKDIQIHENIIYALTESGIKKANTTEELININNWSTLTNEPFNEIEITKNKILGIKNKELYEINEQGTETKYTNGNKISTFKSIGNKIVLVSDKNINILNEGYESTFIYENNSEGIFTDALIKDETLYAGNSKQGLINLTTNEIKSPNGPYSNETFKIAYAPQEQLWFIYGGYGYYFNPWEIGKPKKPFSLYRKNQYETVKSEAYDAICSANVSFDTNSNKAYISSYFDGIIQIDDITKPSSEFEFTKYKDTVEMPVASDNSSRVLGFTVDSNNDTWFSLSLAKKNNEDSVEKIHLGKFDKNMNFTYYNYKTDVNSVNLSPTIDPWNTKWIATNKHGLIAFNETIDKGVTFNSGNSEMLSGRINCIRKDLKNRLWIGCHQGLRIVQNPQDFVNSNNISISNIIITENDKAQELFFQKTILDILVDGGNNKWVSVDGAGVFYISENGQETYEHFTTENSPLPSNMVHSITMNKKTGEVFFGTEKGVVSYTNKKSIEASDELNELKVYPNPLRPNQPNEVTITGLINKANIKITDIAGNLIYETTSLSGSWTWNTLNFNGTLVPSGVYIIHITSVKDVKKNRKKLMIIR